MGKVRYRKIPNGVPIGGPVAAGLAGVLPGMPQKRTRLGWIGS